MDQDKPWQRILITLATVLGTAAAAWSQMPPSQQQIMMLTARAWAQRTLHRAARASGRRAMAAELAGRPEADTGYAITYRLSRLRDRV